MVGHKGAYDPRAREMRDRADNAMRKTLGDGQQIQAKRTKKKVEAVVKGPSLQTAREYLTSRNYDDAAEAAVAYIKEKPDDHAAYGILAEALFKQGRYGEALVAVKGAINRSEKLPPHQETHKRLQTTVAEKYFEELEGKVNVLIAKGDFIGAVNLVQLAEKTAPEYADVYAIGIDVLNKMREDKKMRDEDKQKYFPEEARYMSKVLLTTPIRPKARLHKATSDLMTEFAYTNPDGSQPNSARIPNFLGLSYHQILHVLGTTEVPSDKKSLLLTPEKKQAILHRKLLEMEKRVGAAGNYDDALNDLQLSVDTISDRQKALQKEVMGAPADDEKKTPEVPPIRGLINAAVAKSVTAELSIQELEKANINFAQAADNSNKKLISTLEESLLFLLDPSDRVGYEELKSVVEGGGKPVQIVEKAITNNVSLIESCSVTKGDKNVLVKYKDHRDKKEHVIELNFKSYEAFEKALESGKSFASAMGLKDFVDAVRDKVFSPKEPQ